MYQLLNFRGINPHDIALLRLDRPLKFNRVVNKINLPPSNVEYTGSAVISGWGSTSLMGVTVQHLQLQMNTLNLIAFHGKFCYKFIQ